MLEPCSIKKACKLLQRSRGTVRAMIRDGRVRAKNLNPHGLKPSWLVFLDLIPDPLADPDPADLLWEDLQRRLKKRAKV